MNKIIQTFQKQHQVQAILIKLKFDVEEDKVPLSFLATNRGICIVKRAF